MSDRSRASASRREKVYYCSICIFPSRLLDYPFLNYGPTTDLVEFARKRAQNLGMSQIRRAIYWQFAALLTVTVLIAVDFAVFPNCRFYRGAANACDGMGRVGRSLLPATLCRL